MNFEALFFDLDDTLYPPNTGIWEAIGVRMDTYITDVLGFPAAEVRKLREKLFTEYGTTLRGLKVQYGIDEVKFLDYVHDIPLASYLAPDASLIQALDRLPGRKLIFTNANRGHAMRVMTLLGVDHFFEEIIDILQITPYCKPLRESYEKAITISGIQDAGNCVVIDDSARNIKTACEMGFCTVHVTGNGASPHADAVIRSLVDLPDVLPILKVKGSAL